MKYLKGIAIFMLAAVIALFITDWYGTGIKGGRAGEKVPGEEQAETVAAEGGDREEEAATEAANPTDSGAAFRVTAYIKTEALEHPETFDATHLAELTDIILIGGARFDSAGAVSVGDGFISALGRIKDMTGELPVRIHAALIGPEPTYGKGWEQRMKSMAAEHKKAFESGALEGNILSMLQSYGLDGVSFDYEYPVSEAAKKQFGAFLVSLKRTLGEGYFVGMAVGTGYADFPESAIEAVDTVELMSYDKWDESGMHATLKIAQEDVAGLFELGIPFYARPTTHERVWHAYRDFYDRLDGDGLYHEPGTGLIHSFNTQKTVYDKTAWAVSQGLGGVMVWHYACDVPSFNGYSLFKAIGRAKSQEKNQNMK